MVMQKSDIKTADGKNLYHSPIIKRLLNGKDYFESMQLPPCITCVLCRGGAQYRGGHYDACEGILLCMWGIGIS